MKRLGLIAGMLVLLFAVGSFAMPGSAQDDAVPVLQTQVADLQTRVAALERQIATPGVTVVAASGKAMLFQGTGDQIVNVGFLESGAYVIRGEFVEAGDVHLRFVPLGPGYTITMDWRLEAPGTEWEAFSVMPDYSDAFVLEVHAVGDWTITIESVS